MNGSLLFMTLPENEHVSRRVPRDLRHRNDYDFFYDMFERMRMILKIYGTPGIGEQHL